jgi:hypothetical protein
MMPSCPEAIFSYRLRGWSITYLLFMCTLFSCLMIFLALTQQDNIVGITLGKPIGTLFYGSMASIVMAMAIFLPYRTTLQEIHHNAIVFDSLSVTLPASLVSLKLITVYYKDIKAITMEKIERTGLEFIRIEHGRKQTRISDMGFTKPDDFVEVFQLLNDRVDCSRRG